MQQPPGPGPSAPPAPAASACLTAAAAAAAWQGPQPPRLQNTFRLESQRPFRPERVTQLLEEVVTAELQAQAYDADECARRAVSLAGDIRARVKALDYDRYGTKTRAWSLDYSISRSRFYCVLNDTAVRKQYTKETYRRNGYRRIRRYKYIVKVDIGQKLDQGVCGMATFLWDADRDNYAYFTYENMTLFACATVFAIYYD
ncbi:Uncharacterized protein GBIM_17345 [Gryllus bimaculatus]|nr:Uncharacterized protein GBIM_17345 [Gryllus bimaculatus]